MSARGAVDNSSFTARVNKRRAMRRLKGRSERGAALVEAAIIFLPLCLIVFGIIEYGFIFKDSLTISSATRAGARVASAVPNNSQIYTATVDAVRVEATALNMKKGDELWIYNADANGLPQGGNINSCTTQCQKYSWNGSSFVNTQNNWTIASQKACLNAADSVGVKLRISHDALSGFFKNMQLDEKTVMRFEPQSNCN